MSRVTILPSDFKYSLGDGWEMTAVAASLTSKGVEADIGVHNGELRYSDMVSLSRAKARSDFAKALEERCEDAPTGGMEAVLLTAKGEIDAYLSKVAEQAARDASKDKDAQPIDLLPEFDREALEAEAAGIINSNDILSLFEQEFQKLVTGENRIGRTLYCAGTSRLLDDPMNTALKGPSSGGKSYTRDSVLQFMPPESIVAFTTLSEKSLFFFQDGLEHKILSMGEASGTESEDLQDYLLRELMSEKKLRYPVVKKIDGELTTIVIEKDGPVSFMVTTTKAQLHPENETRMLSLEVDDSREQTKSVLEQIALLKGLGLESSLPDFNKWQAFQRWLELGERRVVIPYAVAIARAIPAVSVRQRRDFSHLLTIIKSHALLHQKHRARDEHGRIVADIEHDYAAAYELMYDLLAESAGIKLDTRLAETLDAVRRLTDGKPAEEGVDAARVATELNLDKSAGRRRLNKALVAGSLVNLEQRRNRPGRYRLADEQAAPPQQAMPDAESLKALYEAMVAHDE